MNPPPGWYCRACEESYRVFNSGCGSKYGDILTASLLEWPVYDGDLSTMTAFCEGSKRSLGIEDLSLLRIATLGLPLWKHKNSTWSAFSSGAAFL